MQPGIRTLGGKDISSAGTTPVELLVMIEENKK